MNTKPLHLVIIDSWHPVAIQRELAAGHLPALRFLLRHGFMALDCASVFPTVTPNCLTALATGVGPDQHGITGVLWYNREADRYVHYWPYPQSLIWGTLDHVLSDFFVNLNGQHLSPEVPTIFEHLEAADISSASVNFPISRGPYLHAAEVPWLIAKLGRLPRQLALQGPRYMRHGDMIRGQQPKNGLFAKFGFNDHQSASHTIDLVRTVKPAFTLTYLNENDLRTHRDGPDRIGWSLRKVDVELGRMLAAYGSWERAVREARWIVTGDHAQSNTYPLRPGYAVNVFRAFPHHRIAPLRSGRLAKGDYDFAVAPNDRMCLFYFPNEQVRAKREVIEEVSGWPVVDQVFWRENGWYYGLRRETGDRVRWRRHGPITDPYGASWEIQGELAVLDARVVPPAIQPGGGTLHYGDFPNAVARVTEALSVPGGASLLITALLGREFTSGFPMGRGNHGSLHAQDTYVPLLTVGVRAPGPAPRLVDVMPMILAAFGIPQPVGGPTVGSY